MAFENVSDTATSYVLGHGAAVVACDYKGVGCWKTGAYFHEVQLSDRIIGWHAEAVYCIQFRIGSYHHI